MIQDRLSQAITPANVWREHEVSSVKTGLSFSGRKCSFHVKHNRLVLRSIEWIFRSFIYSNTFAYQRQPRLDIRRIPKGKKSIGNHHRIFWTEDEKKKEIGILVSIFFASPRGHNQ